MPTNSTTVRFGADVWRLLEREARRQGLSAAQYVRDAAILRLGIALADGDDAEARATLADVAGRALSRRPQPAEPDGAAVLRDPDRRAALHRTGLLDAPADEDLDRLAGLAARVLKAPVALVSLVDADRQVFASCLGLPEPWQTRRQVPLSHSFCQYPVISREPLVVADARDDPRLRSNLAIGDLGVIAYAGIPLITREGQALGALCVIDDRPRRWTAAEVGLLRDLAASVVTALTLRAAAAAA